MTLYRQNRCIFSGECSFAAQISRRDLPGEADGSILPLGLVTVILGVVVVVAWPSSTFLSLSTCTVVVDTQAPSRLGWVVLVHCHISLLSASSILRSGRLALFLARAGVISRLALPPSVVGWW